MPAIPEITKQKEQCSHSQLHGEFEGSLGYVGSCLNKNKKWLGKVSQVPALKAQGPEFISSEPT